MGLIQTAFDFGPPRAVPWLDAEAASTHKRRVIEHKLGELLGSTVALTVTDNARTMLSARHRAGIARVRLHHMFVDADDTTLHAIARYLTDGHRDASTQLQDFIKQNRERIRPLELQTTQPPRNRARVDATGRHHDLHAILDALNHRYFEQPVEALIAWARMARGQGRKRRRRSIKLGSYRGREPLIRVHPVLDAAWVPGFFVEYIVYHEMLHHVIAMPVRNGRRSLHGPDFRARERAFERYGEALAWERENLDRLLSG
jgi:hypothetical protein